MTTTNAKAEGVPNFWKKWWNAVVNCFKRNEICTCSSEHPAAPKVEEPKVQEKKVASYLNPA